MLVTVIGAFDAAEPSHAALEPALRRAASDPAGLFVSWVSPTFVAADGVMAHLNETDLVLGAPGPVEEIDGYMDVVEFAREGGVPYLGIELGMDLAVVEFARSVFAQPFAHSAEFDPTLRDCVVSKLDPPPIAPGKRPPVLGELPVKFTKDGALESIYGAPGATELFRSPWGVPPAVRSRLFREGLKTAATDDASFMVRSLQLTEHPFFVLVGWVPQLGPLAAGAHPLFKAFLSASS